jgi:uncharacterized delta-60 repeat protein
MLDPTFGIGGKVITDFFIESNDFVAAVAIQTDGRIVVAGTTMGTSDGFAIARYNPDGTLDGSFGTNGRFHIDLNSSFSDQASAIAIQSDGKIVVAGGAVNPAPGGNADFAVVRLNGNGSLDTSFDGDGTKLIDIRDSEDGAGDLNCSTRRQDRDSGHLNVFPPPTI